MSDAFIREVDEDLRQKQLHALWKKFGKFIVGIAVGIVLIVAGRSIYSYISESKFNEQAIAFSNAISLNETEIASALDQVIASDVDGYEIIATFKKAELAVKAADKVAAVAILDNFIASASVPEIYKDMANIQAAILELDTASADSIRGRLSLILNGSTSFQFLATELVALAELNAGETQAAKSRLEALIGNVEAPTSIKSRSEQYLSVIE
ncbi:MAG: tetratricopeptide repeat protein [Kordiimonadaceae bacterium]|nr:tetratricopeptide repeat protein [Kordiimonadaceae bacterium]MBT6037326.1 tetratricopeptide repeat protein [Kordiimonadaceae bacterium]MBT6330894.1 tetratricopeptide repeat protein [Kordiimonadaceae bacterium]MBT7582543.1 tetratricopeptide repeat protein [Kordiimonadaceae bacterium]